MVGPDDAGKRFGSILLLLILASAAFASLGSGSAVPDQATSRGVTPLGALAAPSGSHFDYVVVILMENHNLCDIYTHCGGSGTYETSLADTYGIPLKYNYCNVNPSLPNYLCLSGGSDFGCSGYDGGPNSNTCTGVAWNSQNIVDRLETAGLSWKAYMENMPSNCDSSDSGNYAVRHDPFVYYKDIASSSTRCARVVPAGTSDGTFLGDLGSTSTASNYMWLTPNTCNDMHDCSIATGDAYLSNLVPQILNSTVFTTQRAALFITFDEGYGQPTFALWAGPVVKRGFTSNNPYTHFSLLSTLEANWNLPSLNATNDGAAPNMGEFFSTAQSGNPVARFTTAPSWPKVNATVTFDASASSDPNPNATLQYRWDWTNDGTWDTTWSSTPGATHTYLAAGSYTARLQVQDNLGLTGNTTHTVVVDSEPPTTVAGLTGTLGNGGWYRSSVSVKLTATDDLSGVTSTRYRVDGGSWATYSSAFTVTGEGSHSVDYYSVDNAGNTETSHTISLRIDTVAPTTTATLQGDLNGSSYLGPVNVTLSASDTTSGVASTRYRVDGGSWAAYASPVTVSGNGTHTVGYYSTDQAGNTETARNVSFSIALPSPPGSPPPQGPPVTTISLAGTVGNQGWYTSVVNVTLSATDPAGLSVTIQYRLDNGSWRSYSAPFVVSDGVHELQYNATDAASNQEATRVAAIRVDTVPPVTNATLSGAHGRDHWYVSAVTVTLTAADATSGVASTSYRIDGAAWQTYAGPFTVGRGRHTVDYASTDVAGLSETVKSVPIKVDSSGPALTVLSADAVQTVTPVTVVWMVTPNVANIVEMDVSADGGPFASVGLNQTDRLSLPDGEHVISVRAIDEAGNEGWANVTLRVDTNIFSPSGPLQGMPSYILITIVVGTSLFSILHHRSRARRARRMAALRRMRNARY